MMIKLHGPLTLEQVYMVKNLFTHSPETKALVVCILDYLRMEAANRVVELNQIQTLEDGGAAEFYKNVGMRNQLGIIIQKLDQMTTAPAEDIAIPDNSAGGVEGTAEERMYQEEMASRDAMVGLPPMRPKE